MSGSTTRRINGAGTNRRPHPLGHDQPTVRLEVRLAAADRRPSVSGPSCWPARTAGDEGISHPSRMTPGPVDQATFGTVTSAHAAIARSTAALILTASLLTACGSEGGPPVLNWYINPDNGGQSRLAEKCAKASNGAYKVDTQTLPNDASQQREQLVRRLAAK